MGKKVYRTVWEFQEHYPTREAKEKALEAMSSGEIRALVDSCGSVQGKIFYSRFADRAAFRELVSPIAEDLERIWQDK